MELYGQVGPRIVQDGSKTELRQGRFGAMVIVNAHGRQTEPASRMALYTATTALAGTTVAAANVAPPAAAAATIFTIHNPPGSLTQAILSKCVISNVSGTPGAGGMAYCVIWGTTITATPNITPKCNYIGIPSPRCRAFSQTALTGGLIHQTVRPIGHASFAGAIAATVPNLIFEDNLDGEFVLSPGTAFTLAAAATGTSHVVNVALSWDEIPFV